MKLTITEEDIKQSQQLVDAGERMSCSCPTAVALNRQYSKYDCLWTVTNWDALLIAQGGDGFMIKRFTLSAELREQVVNADKDNRKAFIKHFTPGTYELYETCS
jgi:hypothetical protein